MLQRLTIAGIVFFWLLMNAALVRLWLEPETSEILTLPVRHVVQQVFLHEQPSNLSIFQNGRRVGGVTLRPSREDDQGLRIVDFVGSLSLQLPLLPAQAVNWRGKVEMNRVFALRNLKIHLDSHPPKISANLEVDSLSRLATYSVQQNTAKPVTSTLTLDERGARTALEGLGIDPAIVTQLAASTGSVGSSDAGLTVTARQSQLRIHGEHVDVFHLTFRQNTTPMVEADISQLGQVLAVKTVFGFNFAPDE